MRITHLKIENFKGIKDLEIDFMSGGHESPRDLTVLIGDNGSGKTTVLQAIALVLSLATQKSEKLSDFYWPGLILERIGSQGKTRIELRVSFDSAETKATEELYYEYLDFSGQLRHVRPEPIVTLIYENGRVSYGQDNGPIHQFLGRWAIKALKDRKPLLNTRNKEVGDIFYFDQFRSLGSIRPQNGGETDGASNRNSWNVAVENLRSSLIGWWTYHVSLNKKSERDIILPIQEKLDLLFPGLKFHGVSPKRDYGETTDMDFYFLMERNGVVFDIAEMSSGEQAVFPLLCDFVRMDIARSIVLIDELELHLHPPQQQALLAALPGLGQDCQFIITTHSPYLADSILNESKVRLEGGRACL